MFEFQTVRDVMNFAISLEEISQNFYLQLADRVTNAAVREFLLEMAQQEAIHEQQLRSLLENHTQDLSDAVDFNEIQSYVQAMQVPDELNYKKAVKIAYDKERASQMLYSILSDVVQVAYIRELLVTLAKQEKKHKEFFAKEYERICISEN